MVIIYSTLPSEEEAKQFAEKLVRNNLVECAKVFPTSSFYIWEGKLVKDHEGIMILKARSENVPKIESFFASNHPYSIPEFCVVNCDYVNQKYLDWAFSDKPIISSGE